MKIDFFCKEEVQACCETTEVILNNYNKKKQYKFHFYKFNMF